MKPIKSSIKLIVIIILPVLILMTSIRALITPLFPQIEYRLPGFPPDEYGFTTQDRLHWSKYAIDYLTNDEGLNYLGDLTFDDGTALFNERELSHMLDVKMVVRGMIKAWIATLAILILVAVFAYQIKSKKDFWRAIEIGGWTTIGIIFLILILVFTSFEALFVGFHKIFFVGDTWLFYTSDTLIRLFPEKFWSDAFIGIGFLSLLGGAFAIILGKKFTQKR